MRRLLNARMLAQPCLDEMTSLFNRRKSYTLFLDRLPPMITAPRLTFENPTAERLAAGTIPCRLLKG
jgi:hypothetical protein